MSRKKLVVVLNSFFPQLLREKKGGAVRNRWEEGSFLFLFVSNRIFTNCHSRSNINCKSHHNKPATSGTNRNTAPTASVPSSNGSVPTTKWSRPDSTDHCTITKRCYYTGSDSHSTGSSRSRPTTGMSTDNRTANVERSIPSFFGGMNQIRELIL